MLIPVLADLFLFLFFLHLGYMGLLLSNHLCRSQYVKFNLVKDGLKKKTLNVFVVNEQGGELVAVLRGANAPQLQRMIVEELAKEKLVLEQGGERKTVSSTHTFTRAETLGLSNSRHVDL